MLTDVMMSQLLLSPAWNAGALSTAETQVFQALQDAVAELHCPIPILFPDPASLARTLQRQVTRFLPAALWVRKFPERSRELSLSGSLSGPDAVPRESVPLSLFWPARRCGGVRNSDILRQMDLALREGWTLLKFSSWLEETVGKKPERKFLLEAFLAVVDQDVLREKRSKPRIRPTLTEICVALEMPAHSQTLHRWTKHWLEFAVRMGGQHAIRPHSTATQAYLHHFEKGRRLRELFEQAAASDSLPPEKSLQLFQGLSREGFGNEALVVSNILVGIHEGERLHIQDLGLEGLTRRGAVYLEERLEELARRFRFPVKGKK